MAGDTQGTTILAVTWVLAAFATVAFSTRVYTRFFYIHQGGWDDWAMILTWLLAMTSGILVTMSVRYGLGRDIKDIKNPSDQVNAVKYLTIAPVFSILSVGIGKISIVLFLFRLMGITVSRIRFWLLWAMMFISMSLNIAAVVVVLRFCTPTEAIWDPAVEGECIDPNTQLGIGLAQASFNAFTDLFLAVFPSWVLWSLNLQLWRKIALTMVTGAGVFGAVITGYKAYQLRNLPGHDNLTVTWAPITIWNTTEMYVLIVTASVPAIKPLFEPFLNSTSYAKSGSYPLQSRLKSDTSRKERFNIETAGGGGDNTSVDGILPGGDVGSTTILKTEEFTVSSQSAAGSM